MDNDIHYNQGYVYCGFPSAGPIPNCVCPAGYTGTGYGSNGCVMLTTICQNRDPCVNGECLVSVGCCVYKPKIGLVWITTSNTEM